MSAQAAGRAVSAAAKTATKATGEAGLSGTKSAKRDPELFVLGTVMAAAVSIAGFYFGRKPTSSSSEAKVAIAHGSMPWNQEVTKGDEARDEFKYKYHPGGDPKNPPKEAPSAMHSVIIPNVNLPKHLHERFNKWGKDDY